MKLILSIFLLLLSRCIFADVSISADRVEEYYSDSVKVSGKFYLGAQYSSKSNMEGLYTFLPAVVDETLCVELRSVDGRYKAALRYLLAGKYEGKVHLKFNSKYNDVFGEYQGSDIAIRSYLGENCENSKSVRNLFSSWSEDNDENSLVLFIRSSSRKDIVYINGGADGVKCRKIRGKYAVSYDKYCELKDSSPYVIKDARIKRRNLQKAPDKLIEFGY